jgi:hypothetical protein
MEDSKLMKKLILILLAFCQITFGQVQFPTGYVSSVNSSSATLGISGVFTGTSEDVSQFAEVRVIAYSDVASATNGLSMQQSSDGTNWDITDGYSVPAATGKTYGVGVSAKYFRLVYTNGGTGQASFRIQTVYHKFRTKPSSQKPQDGRTNDNDMEENLSYSMLFNGTTFDRGKTFDQFITGQGTQTASGQNIILATAGTGSQDISGYKSISIQIVPTGTVSSGVVTFEGSNDNTNWSTVPMYKEDNQLVAPVTTCSPLTSTPCYLVGSVYWRYFRARISTVIGGGGSIQAFTQLSALGYNPDHQSVMQEDLFFTGQSAQTATINNIIPSTAVSTATDANGYRSGSIQVVSTGTGGGFIFEGSNDNTNFQTIPVWSQLILTGTPIVAAITPTSSNLIYVFPINCRYIRLRISTTVTGGSIQAFTKLSQNPYTPAITQVAQATAANLNATVTGTITAVTTLSNGQTAHSATSTGSPLRGAGRVMPTTAATVDATLLAGEAADLGMTTNDQLVIKPFATSELDYNFHVNSAATVTTLQPIIPASGTANIRNYITGFTLQTDALGAAGNAWILDGQGAIGTSVTIATPGVFTSTTHDLKIGDAIVFTSLGTITGVSTNTVYWVTATSFAATTFTVATTQGGTAIQITGSTAAFTFYRVLYPFRLQTTAIGTPVSVTFPTPIKGFANAALNFLIPTSLTSGNIYLTVNGYRGF